MNIYLLGYMGSGKSTIGKALAEALSYDFLDFDQYIVTHEKMSIPEIFEAKGEIYFRKKESHYLNQLLSEARNKTIVALGGGTPCYGMNMQNILQSGNHTIYINVSYKQLAERLWNDRENRPLVNDIMEYSLLEDYVRKHLFERGFYYNRAHRTIKVSDETPTEVARSIIERSF